MSRLAMVLVLGALTASCSAPHEPIVFQAERVPPGAEPPAPPAPADWSKGMELEEAVALALAQNPRQRVALHEIYLARAQRVTAGTYPYNPEIGFEGSRGAPFSSAQDYTARLGLRQTFEIAGQRGYRIAAADANIERSRWTVSDAQRILRAETALSFYEVLSLQKRQDLMTQIVDFAKRSLDAAEARQRAQQIPILEVNLVRTRYQQALIEQERALRELARARARMGSLLGDPKRLDFQARGELGTPLVLADGEKLMRLAEERRPDLRALRASQAAAASRVSLARASAWPDPTVGIFGERNVSRFPVLSTEGRDGDNLVGVDLSFALPLFNRRRGEILEAEVEVRRTGAEIDATLQDLRRDIELGLQRLGLAKTTLDLYEKELNRLSKENMEDVQKAYKGGEVGTLELLRAQEDFTRVSLSYLDAQYELRIAIAELEAAAGAPLSEMK